VPPAAAIEPALINFLELALAAHGDVHVAQQSVRQIVDPAVDLERFAAIPRALHDRGFAHVQHLLDDVQFAEPSLA
jgi:hypothetical protein